MDDLASGSGSADRGTVVERIETLSCDAAWRSYCFLKITTADGMGHSFAAHPPRLSGLSERRPPAGND